MCFHSSFSDMSSRRDSGGVSVWQEYHRNGVCILLTPPISWHMFLGCSIMDDVRLSYSIQVASARLLLFPLFAMNRDFIERYLKLRNYPFPNRLPVNALTHLIGMDSWLPIRFKGFLSITTTSLTRPLSLVWQVEAHSLCFGSP